MYNTTFYNAALNLYKQTTSFQRQLMAVLKRQNKARMNSAQAKNTTKLGVSVYYLRIRPPFFFLQPTKQKSMNKKHLKIFISPKKKVIFHMFRKIKQATKICCSKP